MDIIELILDENDELNGVDAISLVENPAIEENFVALKNQRIEFKAINEEKRIVVGLALIPNKPIYRRSGDKEYYIFFSKETVRKTAELYLKNQKNNNATLEHNLKAEGVSVVESWVVEDPSKDKTAIYGLNAVEGAWAVVMKIYNDEIWADVKKGTYKGLSIEGFFADKLERPNDKLKENLKEMSVEEKLIEELKNIVLASERVELGLTQDALNIFKALDKVKNKIENDLSALKKQAILGDSGIKNFNKKANDIEKMAKELGVSVSDINLQKLFAEVKEMQKLFDDIIKA